MPRAATRCYGRRGVLGRQSWLTVASTSALLASALACAPAFAATSTPDQPTGTASGTLRVAWTETLHAARPQLIRTDGGVTFTIEDRFRAPGEPEAWVTDELPDFARTNFRRHYGYLLRARIAVDRFTTTADDVCEDGSAVRTTTVVTAVTQPHGLLATTEPTLNLVRRTGTTGLAPDDETERQGVFILAHSVVGTGRVTTHTTGADCNGFDDQGRSAPSPVDRTDELSLARLMGGDVATSIIASPGSEIPVRVAAGGATVMDHEAKLVYIGTHPERESIEGTWKANVRWGGPPRAQRASCELPSVAELRRVHSLAAARRLLRRHGIPGAVYGGARYDQAPQGSFIITSASPLAVCGATLGTHKFPLLYRSRGLRTR